MILIYDAWIHLTFLGLLSATIGRVCSLEYDEGTTPYPWLHEYADDVNVNPVSKENGTEAEEEWDGNEPDDEMYYVRNFTDIDELFYEPSQLHCGDNDSYYVPETEECYRVFYCPESLRYRWRSFSWSTCAQPFGDRRWFEASANCFNKYEGELFDFMSSPDIKLRFAWWMAKKIALEMADDGYLWSMGIGTRMDGTGKLIRTTGGIFHPKYIMRSQKDFSFFRAYKATPCLYGDICCLRWYPGTFLNYGDKTVLVARRSCDQYGGGTHLCQKNATSGTTVSVSFTDGNQLRHMDEKDDNESNSTIVNYQQHQQQYSITIIFGAVLTISSVVHHMIHHQ